MIAIVLVRQMSRALSKLLWIGLLIVAAAAITATRTANAAGTISEDNYKRCLAIIDDKARLLCFENLTSSQPQIASPPVRVVPPGIETTPLIPQGSAVGSQIAPSSLLLAGKWRLSRIPDPRRGKDVVSIMSTPELSGSDIDFAGLSLRCADQDFEVLIFLLSPMPPETRPTIAINGRTFQGRVVSPGTIIMLPREASLLAQDQWRLLPSLSIEVADDGTKTHGLVSLEGFDTALQTLVGACSAR